jgi:hypothetical protein
MADGISEDGLFGELARAVLGEVNWILPPESQWRADEFAGRSIEVDGGELSSLGLQPPDLASRNLVVLPLLQHGSAALSWESRVLSQLPHDRSVGLVVPGNLLRRLGARKLLASALTTHWVGECITFDGDLIREARSLTFGLLVLVPDPPLRVRFVDGRGQGVSAIVRNFGALSEHQFTGFGFAVEGPVEARLGGFDPSQHDPRRINRLKAIGSLGSTVPLDEYLELLPATDLDTTEVEIRPGRGLVPVLGASMIDENGKIDVFEASRWAPRRQPPLKPGDLVLAGEHGGSSLRVAEITDDSPRVAIGHAFVLRPRTVLSQREKKFVAAFLRSEICLLQLNEIVEHKRQGNVRARELRDLLVPMPDGETLDAFEQVFDATQQFYAWHQEGKELINVLLSGEELEQARSSLIQDGLLLRQRQHSASELDDLGARIRHSFPLPLAQRWRALEARRDEPEELDSILASFEVLLAYLGCLGFVSAVHNGIQLTPFQLSGQARGIGLGHWKGLLREIAESKHFSQAAEIDIVEELPAFCNSPVVKGAIDRLYRLRNDDAHLRRAAPGEKQTLLEKSRDDIALLFEEAQFVTDYTLLLVEQTGWDAINETNTLRVRELRGDHPSVPTKNFVTNEIGIERGSLYVRSRKGELFLVRPMMLGKPCPECDVWSVFVPDRALGAEMSFKSLEHGHELKAPEFENLQQVGFLAPQRHDN